MEFTKNMVIEELTNRGYIVSEQTCIKNGIEKNGITIKKSAEDRIAPTLYLDEITQDAYERDMSLEELVDRIESLVGRKFDFDIDKFFSADYIAEHIHIGVQKEGTEELLRQLSTTRFAPGEKLNSLLKEKGQPEVTGSLKAEELLKRPEIRLQDLTTLQPEWAEISPAVAEQAEISVKYAGYLEKEAHMIKQARQIEETLLPKDICYAEIEHLRLEARQKLAKQKPVSLGAAGRIPGVNPADVAVLEVWLRTREHNKAAGS